MGYSSLLTIYVGPRYFIISYIFCEVFYFGRVCSNGDIFMFMPAAVCTYNHERLWGEKTIVTKEWRPLKWSMKSYIFFYILVQKFKFPKNWMQNNKYGGPEFGSWTTIAKWQGRWCYGAAGLVIRHENPDFNIILGGWDGCRAIEAAGCRSDH